MTWLPSGRVINPALNAVLVDTGPLTAETRTVQVHFACTVAAAVELQLRDAADALTLKSQILAVPTGGGMAQFGATFPDVPMADNQRLRVIAVAAIVGAVSVSLDFA
jgi:hypothetical protein